MKFQFTPTSDDQVKVADSREKVADSREPKSYDLAKLLTDPERVVDPGAKVVKPKGKTTAAQRKAIAKYEENFKRINCRLTPEMYQRIQNTGKSANTVIVEALTAYFAEK